MDSVKRHQIAMGVALGITLTLFCFSSVEPQVNEVQIPLSCLPKEFDGLTMVQISDIHLGSTNGKSFLSSVVKTVKELKPTLILITGGLIGIPHKKPHIDIIEPLDELRDYMTVYNNNKSNVVTGGIYFVSGYNEYLSGTAETWAMELYAKGIQVLQNEWRVVNTSSKVNQRPVLHIAGIDDWWSGFFYRTFGSHPGPDINKAIPGKEVSKKDLYLHKNKKKMPIIKKKTRNSPQRTKMTRKLKMTPMRIKMTRILKKIHRKTTAASIAQ